MIIDNIVSRINAKPDKEDYINQKDGLLYCGHCDTPKELYLPISKRKVPTLCKCKTKDRDAKELKEKLERKQNMLNGEISPCFQKARFENVNVNKHKYVVKLRNYIDNFKVGAKLFDSGIGLFIYGDTGNGKTFLASCLANEMQKQGHWVIMLSMQDALSKIKNFDTRDQFSRDISMCDLLILDDFGAEMQNDYSKKLVEEIIDKRCNSKKPLVITTNINRNDLLSNGLSLNDYRIGDRLLEMTHAMLVEVPSVRQEQSARRFEDIENILNRGL